MTPTLSEPEIRPIEEAGLWRDAWTRFRRNRAALAAAIVVLVIVVASRGASAVGYPLALINREITETTLLQSLDLLFGNVV